MGFWPYLRHAHGSDDDAPPSATGISRTTFFSWLFLLPNHSRGGEKEKRAEIKLNFERKESCAAIISAGIYLCGGRMDA